MDFALKTLICCIASIWTIRYAVRAELKRAGLFRAQRPLSEREDQEVMALMAEGKFSRAEALRDHYRFNITQPE